MGPISSAIRLVATLLFVALLAYPARADSAAQVDEPAGALPLAQALALALSRNPDLAVFSWQVRASEARMLQAGLRPNPDIGLEVEDVAGTGSFSGARQAQTTLRLSQLIELGGKRAARQGVATAAHDVATQGYEVKRVEVLAAVTERFIQLLGAQQQLALAQESMQLAETALGAVRVRIQAGKASALEGRKAAITLARSRISREHAAHELIVARKALAATWASTGPVFQRAEGDLFERKHLPPFEALASRLTASPEITRWVSEKRLREAEITLADTKRVPNPIVTAGVRRLEGPDAEAFLAQFWVPLPVFDRNQGGSAEARILAQKTAAGQQSTAIHLHTVLFGLYQELLHAATAMESLQQDILPQAKEALALSQQGFSDGRFSYLDLLDAQRTFVEVQKEAIETAVLYQQLLLGVERLLGQPIESASPQPSSTQP